jgi:hypothetical protein
MVAVLGVVLLTLPACGLNKSQAHHDDDASTVSADKLEMSDDEGAIYALLDPEEREAAEHAGIGGADATAADAEQPADGAGDTAGKAGLSFLSVAIVVGAAIAPLFLF